MDLATRGVVRTDRSTWTAPVIRLNCPEGGPFVAAGTAQALWEAYDQLLGEGKGGDVYICHPFLVHAASWPHRGPHARMIAQPGMGIPRPLPSERGPISARSRPRSFSAFVTRRRPGRDQAGAAPWVLT